MADGSLDSSADRADLEADPELNPLLHEQRQAVTIVRAAAASVKAPDALRERLATLTPAVDDEPPVRIRRPSRSPAVQRRRLTLFGGGALAAVVVVVLLVVLLGGGSPRVRVVPPAPTVAEAAALGALPATLPAPRHVPHSSVLLNRSEAGVAFPDWYGHFRWRAVGARTDTFAGRSATTVFYSDRRHRRVAYAIVSGAILPAPAGARSVVHSGVPLLVAAADGRTLVTWTRGGHSCVLSGTGVSAATLERLAGWRANGTIPY